MTLLFASIPLMILAVSVAIVPLVVAMRHEHRLHATDEFGPASTVRERSAKDCPLAA